MAGLGGALNMPESEFLTLQLFVVKCFPLPPAFFVGKPYTLRGLAVKWGGALGFIFLIKSTGCINSEVLAMNLLENILEKNV